MRVHCIVAEDVCDDGGSEEQMTPEHRQRHAPAEGEQHRLATGEGRGVSHGEAGLEAGRFTETDRQRRGGWAVHTGRADDNNDITRTPCTAALDDLKVAVKTRH